MRRSPQAAGIATAVLLLLVLSTATPVRANGPLLINWPALLPGFTIGYRPTSENLCVQGDLACVDAVIDEMDARYQNLVASCDHNAMFSLTYLRTTEAYRRAIEDPLFFTDTAFINHQDAVFARYYFDAWDAYRAGNLGSVPIAWQLAFDAADRRSVAGLGNLLLGMSAHVNRDLPYVLAAIGLRKPDGKTRKIDHDRVNRFLIRVIEPLFDEAAARLDPTVDDVSPGFTTIDESVAVQLLFAWRELAWRNAERLVAARTPASRRFVENTIELAATLEAQTLIAAFAYRPLRPNAAAKRDAWCAAHADP